MSIRIIAILIATTSVALAAPPEIKLPDTLKGNVAEFIVVRADTDGQTVIFYPLDPGLQVFPAELLADRRATVVTAARTGKYRLLAYTGNQDGPSKPAVTVIVVGSDSEPRPEPKPDGKYGLRKISREAVASVAEQARREKSALAAAIRGHASVVASGAYDQYTGENKAAWIMHGLRQVTQSAVTMSQWQSWSRAVSPALERLYRSGQLAQNSDWASAFEEIASGLED